MAYFDMLSFMKINNPVSFRRVLCGVLVLVAVVGLSACGSKEKKSGQALVKVNGEEITSLQLNDELSRAGVKPDQQEAATRQLLEAMIDRQLIVAEAMRNKIDRTPEVMKAIERAKAQIIAQTYLQSITSKTSKPSQAEIEDQFQSHPERFAQRKQFDIKQLVIATIDFSDKLNQVIDSAKTLDEIAEWLDRQGIKYTRGQLSRSTADMPIEMGEKLQAVPKGQLFIVREGKKTLINALINVSDSPVTLKEASPQIEQYLMKKKSKEIADAEITHLRSLAKIEYLGALAPAATKAPAVTPETDPAGAVKNGQAEGGVTGSK